MNSNPFRILILSYGLSGHGGTEAILSSWGNFFQNNNIEYKILIYDRLSYDEKLASTNYEVVENKSPRWRRLHLIKELYKTQYHAVICMEPKYLRYVLFARKFCVRHQPKIYFWPHISLKHLHYSNQPYSPSSQDVKAVQQIDSALLLSSDMQEQIHTIFKLPGTTSKVVYNPVQKQSRTIHPSTTDTPQFIFIGRFENRQKNIFDLIDAFSLIDRPYQLRLIGDGVDRKPILAYLRAKDQTALETIRLAKAALQFELFSSFLERNKVELYIDYLEKNLLQNKVIIEHQWRSSPWDSIEHANALVLTSNFEGFGMVLAEAISYGIPCISANCPVGPADIIQHGINGYLYQPGDVRELKNYILDIMNKQLTTSPEDIKASISHLYEESYYSNLLTVLDLPKGKHH